MCLQVGSVPVGWAIDIILDFVIMILFQLDERHCEWEVIVVITIEFVDGVDIMDDFIWTVAEHFELAETIGSGVEFSSKILKDCTVILVECDSLV